MSNVEEKPQSQRRVLGDQWREWKGERTPADASASPALFFGIAFVVLACATVCVALAAYLVLPRLASFHPHAGIAAVTAAALVALALWYWYLCLVLTVFLKRNVLYLFPRKALRTFLLRHSFTVAHILRVDADRLRHAFIKVHNTIVHATTRPRSASKVLILLPRCLRKDILDDIRARERGDAVICDVVGGGTQALKTIKEKRPDAIVAVACERDLVAGLRDVPRSVPVIAIPNQRPEGPCVNACVDVRAIDAAVSFLACDAQGLSGRSG